MGLQKSKLFVSTSILSVNLYVAKIVHVAFLYHHSFTNLSSIEYSSSSCTHFKSSQYFKKSGSVSFLAYIKPSFSDKVSARFFQ
jgi:hypothetical protein